MRLPFIFLLFLLPLKIFSATENLDSLESALKIETVDSIRAKMLTTLSKEHANKGSDEALKYINRLRDISKQKNYGKHLIDVEANSFIYYSRKGKLKEALKYGEKMYSLAKALENQEKMAEAKNKLGINYTRLGEYDKAVELFTDAITISKKHNILNVEANSYLMLGILSEKRNKIEVAHDYLLKALDAANKSDKKDRLLPTIYSNLSSFEILLGRYDEAAKHLNNVIDIYKKKNDLNSLSIAYNNKAILYYHQEDFETALKWFEESKKLKVKQENIIGIALIDMNMAEILMNMKNYKKALRILDSSKVVFDSTGTIELLIEAYNTENKINIARGDFKAAHKSLEMYHKLNDSIHNKASENKIAEIETHFKVAEKEWENERLKEQSENQNLIIIIILILSSLILILAVALIFKNRSMNKTNEILKDLNTKLEDKQLRIENQNYELAELNSDLVKTNRELSELNAMKDKFFSIISHDLKSPLSSLYLMIEMLVENYNDFSGDELEETLELLKASSRNTSSLLENLLTWSRTQMNKVDFNPELISMHNLAESTINALQSSAYIKHIKIDNNIPENLKVSCDYPMISTVIRNITNNSIKFTPEGGKIIVSAADEKDYLRISIEDNGVGMNEDAKNNLFLLDKASSTPGTNNEKGTGLGLIIVKEFIEKHEGKIWAESEKGIGTTFHFTIKKD